MSNKKIKDRIKQYEENKRLVELGQFKYVPFEGFPRLQRYIPGIIPSIMYKITSHMGIGKTKLSKYLFVYQPLIYAIKHNINFKILYFALEESEQEFIDDLVIHVVKRIKGVQLDRFPLMGTSPTMLKKDELEAIKECEKAVANLMYSIEVIDNCYTPSSILKTCIYYAKKWGKFSKDKEGNDILDSYIPNDPSQIVLVVTDHISLLAPEYDKESNTFLSLHRTMAKWHTEIARKTLAKAWKWSVLNVQQQSLDSERQQFTTKGHTIINKILPSLDGLGDNKLVGRDDYVVLGLFAPERYLIDKYLGYEIKNNTLTSFGDRFRSLHLLKNRFGHPNKILPLYFDGRYSQFNELPRVADTAAIKKYYNLLKK